MWECFPIFFSFTSFTVVLDSSSAYGEAVCIFKAPKRFSSDALSSRHLFSSATAMAASAPGVLAGLGLAVLGLFSDFFQVRVLCEILDLVLGLRVWLGFGRFIIII